MRALVLGGAAVEAAVAQAIAPHGFVVVRAADVAGAAALTSRERCPLVLIDWTQPDAAASCRAIADLPQCAASTLIAITPEAAPEGWAEIFVAGAADVLALPADTARLVARVLHARASIPGVDPRLFRPVFERNPLPMCLIDATTTRVLAVSDGALRQYGYSRDEFLRMTLREFRPPEEVPNLDAAIERADPYTDLAATHRRKDGSTFRSQGVVQRLELDGRELCFAVSRDVTAELRAAETQRRALASYEELVERSADGVFTHRSDEGCTVAYANPAFVAFLGYTSAGELLDRSVLDLVHPDDREAVRGRIRGIFSTGQPSPPRAIRFLGADGNVRMGETRGIRVTYEDRVACTVIARDLTERHRAEEALRLSEERFSRVFQASPASISITRLSDGRFVEVNERFQKTTGYSRADVIGKTGLEVGLWDDPSYRDTLYEVIQRDGCVRDLEVRLRKKSGERVEVLMSTEIVEVGGERCMLALGVDVSERKRLDEQLRQSHKMEAIGRLAGGIAHDFNNLLTGIRGYSELLVEQLAAGSTARDAAQHIHRSALRAASLTGQLLVFTRRQAVQPQVLVLDDVVRQMGALLRRIIGGDIALELELGAASARVRLDKTQLEQVILNLAVNARDAMPKGGQLLIATSECTDERGGCLCLSVRDTGTGMDEAVRAHIFEPFFTTKEMGRGTGLGLSIVYGIVEQSGGKIRVETEPGRGTTFRISLPKVDAPLASAGAEPAPGRAPRGHEVILVVEDDEDVRDFVELVLKRAGYEVLVAEDGARAIEVASDRRDIQLLLSDVVMPRMSGRELAVELERLRPGLRIMHMSGYPGSAPREEATSAPFLQKPFSAEELLRRVRATLEP